MKSYGLAILLTCFVFSGCVSTHDQLIKAGYDSAYADGYTHGESSGYYAANNPYYKFTKDTRRYDADGQYKQGWDDGFQVTKTKYENLSRDMHR